MDQQEIRTKAPLTQLEKLTLQNLLGAISTTISTSRKKFKLVTLFELFL
jgi:hypothetical protein